jgi:hypothetical protein
MFAEVRVGNVVWPGPEGVVVSVVKTIPLPPPEDPDSTVKGHSVVKYP